ncbi:hypothetical protein [Acinetobacter sp. ANC 4470]|nr:hypothetical protein [Acinetobacter sp. ANC 4470]
MQIIARLILIIGVLVWLGPAVIGFLLMMLLFWLLVALAGWNKPPHS